MSSVPNVSDWLPGRTPRAAFQAAIDSLYGSGGSLLIAPPGNFVFDGPITIKGGTILQGSGRGATFLNSAQQDIPMVIFDSTCTRASMRDVFVCGRTERDAMYNVVEIAENMPVHMRDCDIWGGNTALHNQGVDCRIRDCFISGSNLACLVSNGANFYDHCKFDTIDDNKSPQWCIFQGTPNNTLQTAGVCENFFNACDFSGAWQQGAIYLDDTQVQNPMLYTMFNGCVISGSVHIARAKHTTFGAGTRFGSSNFINGGGSVSVQGCASINGLRLPDNVERGTGNINISGGAFG